ncbi:MAG: sulfatase family protein [Planctomycetota bacterium]|jgi:arylsulfatase A-like enzyme
MGKPNILWICTDQQRFDALGCYGNRFVRTPNVDALARDGTLFEHAFAQSPVSTPSRASFLTGRYPRTTRCRQNGQDIPADEVLVTRLLAEAGYVCGLSGKLHLSTCNPSACKTMERRIDDGYAEFHWSHHSGGGWPTNEYHLWLEEKGEKFERRPHPRAKHVQFGPPAHLHQTTWCAEKAVDFMEARAEDGAPWLFSVNTFDPHHPFDPPEDRLARYMDRLDEIPLPNYVEGELADKTVWQRCDHGGAYGGHGMGYPDMTDSDHRLARAAYWAMCDLIDEQVGRMLDALRRTGQRDNTIVIFTSDHGEMLGDHGIYLKGPHFYEPAVHVPLVISGPGMLREQRSPALVELTDLAQTLLDAAGLPHHPGMQGRSLWPMLAGGADAGHHRDDVYSEYYNAMQCHTDPPAHATMVRTARHKIVVAHGTGGGELYDLEADPNETRNLWDDAEHARVKADMLVRVGDRAAWTVDPMPPRRAAW